jgi:hypothetical protein
MIKIRELTEADVQFTVTVEDEIMKPSQHFEDKDIAAEVSRDLYEGNVWAWCGVKVTAIYKNKNLPAFEGKTFLGCCSYESEDDFKQDGYYPDLKKDALRELNDKLQDYAKVISELQVV